MDTCYPLMEYCQVDLFTSYIMYNLADIHWDILNSTLSQYYLHIQCIFGLKGLRCCECMVVGGQVLWPGQLSKWWVTSFHCGACMPPCWGCPQHPCAHLHHRHIWEHICCILPHVILSWPPTILSPPHLSPLLLCHETQYVPLPPVFSPYDWPSPLFHFVLSCSCQPSHCWWSPWPSQASYYWQVVWWWFCWSWVWFNWVWEWWGHSQVVGSSWWVGVSVEAHHHIHAWHVHVGWWWLC